MSNFPNLWNLLNNKEKQNCLIDSIQYRKNTLQENPKTILDVEYTCTEDKCDLETVVKSIKDSVELRAHGTQKVLENVVEIMNNNQDEYMPSKMEAFEVNKYGKSYMTFKRADVNENPGIVGYICYETLVSKCKSKVEEKKYTFYDNFTSMRDSKIEKYCSLM